MDKGDSRYHTIKEAIRTKRADIEEIKSEIGDLIHRKHRINGINESVLTEEVKWGQTTQGHNGQVQKSFHLAHPNGSSVQYHLNHTAHPTHPHSLV